MSLELVFADFIVRILYLTDPETFASLVLVDHGWRSASQTPHLYAHHLSRCPSFSRSHNVVSGPFTDDSLPQLKRQFAREVKRNLFEAYLQPRRTLISLVSTTTSSSAAFPGGEAFDFSFSPSGHWVLALSSSRIYVIDTVSTRISVQRELKVLRRPVSAAILDDGSRMAVLSSDQKVCIYNLSNLEVKHLRSVSFDNPPHSIALAPKGEVLVAAYDGGIEVHSLGANALESDRRAIKCDRVDSLKFSSDGTMLLGTTKNNKNPNTVVLSAPYYSEENQELPASDHISHLWTSQILFPNSSRDCSHATLLPNRSDGDAHWTFTFDKVFESFRAVRTDDLRNGTTYFTGPKPPRRDRPSVRKKLAPCTLPASSDRGELVAAGFSGNEVWLYGVPEGLDTSTMSQTDDPNSQPQSCSSAGPSTPSSEQKSPARSLTRSEAAELMKLPKWQVLVDKYRNVFAKGRRVAEISGVSGVCWVSRKHEKPGPQALGERLVIAAPGGIPGDPDLEQDGFAAVDGGRLVILDFDRTVCDGQTEEITFEVGNDDPELLEEESLDIDTEVAIARRRTVKRDLNPGSTVAEALASAPALPDMPALAPTANAIANARSLAPSSTNSPTTGGSHAQGSAHNSGSPGEGLSLQEASEFFDGPYSHTQPRSRTSLYRSATAVAANRERNPPRIIHDAHVEYRRPDGRGELPHESDADNWVPPPPPYTAESDRPLPDHLRMSLMPRSTEPFRRVSTGRDRLRRASTMYEGPVSPASSASRRISSLPIRPSSMQRQSETSSHGHRAELSISDTFSQRSGAVSPLSSVGFSFPDELSELSSASQQTPPSPSSRRPMSAYVGRLTHSLRRPNTAKSISPVAAIAESLPSGQPSNRSVSLPPSPTRPETPGSPLTLTGANLQQRLEYPLPPAPLTSSVESLHRRYVSHGEAASVAASQSSSQRPENVEPLTANMPSAQQLANLNNRSRQAPSPQAARPLPPGITNSSGYPIPAPPRGALGAAGSLASSTHRVGTKSLLVSNRNTFARSSPTLLRPPPRRLDTIESVSSFVSRPHTRSRSRDLHTVGSESHRRSQSVGPALRLDRIPTAPLDVAPTRKGWLGGRKGKKSKGRNRENPADGFVVDDPGKGGKCVLM